MVGTSSGARVMIRNGLYHITVEMLDGVRGGNQGVMVVRNGTLRGGDSFFYAYGTSTAANRAKSLTRNTRRHSVNGRYGSAKW